MNTLPKEPLMILDHLDIHTAAPITTYDNTGTYTSTSTPQEIAALLTAAATDGGNVTEWYATDRAEMPIRIVHIDLDGINTTSVIPLTD